MAEWVDLAGALRSADPAGLLTDSDVNVAVEAVQKSLTEWTFTWPRACPRCGHMPPQVLAKAQRGLVLDVDGLHKVKHIPRRCRRHGCPHRNVYLWHNFHVKERNVLSWLSLSRDLPCTVMLTQRFGVTRRWYHQFSTRIVIHMASFWGEAKVHWRPGFKLSFNRFKLKLEDAWFKLRLVQRCWLMQPNKPVILSADRETLLGGLTKSYDALMLRLRQDQVKRSGGADSVRGLVIDGHVKAGARRRCGVPCSAAARCEPLKAWCLTSCPRTPAYKQKFCHWHQSCVSKFLQGDTAFESVSRSNSLAKNSDDLLAIQLLSTENTPYSRKLSQLTPSQNMDLQGYLTTDFFKQLAAKAAAEKEIQDLNCQTHKTGGGKSQRSGGLLVACRKDGLIAHVSEYQGPESLSQRYCFLASLKASYPSMCICIHDDGCHLRRYAENRHLSAGCFFPLVQWGVPSHTGNNKIFSVAFESFTCLRLHF